MTSVNSAETNLSELLDRVSRGEEITILTEGVPVAALLPLRAIARSERREAVNKLREFGKGRTLGNLSIREMIDEGRH